jgi:hypothetical protein
MLRYLSLAVDQQVLSWNGMRRDARVVAAA